MVAAILLAGAQTNSPKNTGAMRADINRLINNNIALSPVDNEGNDNPTIVGKEELERDINRLMCYREARAFCQAFVNGQGCTALEMANKYLLKQGYSTKDIEIAIEQVKNEQK